MSIVTFPANPAAQISNVKSAVEALETLAEAERYLRDGGLLQIGRAGVHRPRQVPVWSGDSDELGQLKQRLTALRTAIV